MTGVSMWLFLLLMSLPDSKAILNEEIKIVKYPEKEARLENLEDYEDSTPRQISSPLDRCTYRLHHTLGNLSNRRSSQADTSTLDLSGYALHQSLRSAPYHMYITNMKIRLPYHKAGYIKIDKCRYDDLNKLLQTNLLFRDLTISGNIQLYNDDMNFGKSLGDEVLAEDNMESKDKDETMQDTNENDQPMSARIRNRMETQDKNLHKTKSDNNNRTNHKRNRFNRNNKHSFENGNFRFGESLHENINEPFNVDGNRDDTNVSKQRSIYNIETNNDHFSKLIGKRFGYYNGNDKNNETKNHVSSRKNKNDDKYNNFKNSNSRDNLNDDNHFSKTFYDHFPFMNRQLNNCNMTLKLKSVGLGFSAIPETFIETEYSKNIKIKTTATYLEPNYISIHAYNCKNMVNRRRFGDDVSGGGGDDEDEVENEMEQVFIKGTKSLLTNFMEKQFKSVLRDSLMSKLGFTVSYG